MKEASNSVILVSVRYLQFFFINLFPFYFKFKLKVLVILVCATYQVKLK